MGNGNGAGGSGQPSRTMDPPFLGRFRITVDGVEIGSFTEVSGLAVEVEVEEVKEGGQNHFVHKLPGRMKWPNLVLKRGLTDNNALFEWFSKTSGQGFAGQGNKLSFTTGSITLLHGTGEGTAARTWKFVGAFPVKWSGPTLAASSREVAVEQLEIAHHGFTCE